MSDVLEPFFEQRLSEGDFVAVTELIPAGFHTATAVATLRRWIVGHRSELELSSSFIGVVGDDRRWYVEDGERRWLIDGVTMPDGSAVRVIRWRPPSCWDAPSRA